MKLRKHKTLREQIVTSLRDSIVRGELEPGQKLTEPELSARLGISRTPIREAFRQLESEGFLNVIPRRGAVVATITRKEITDFYELKSLLEGYAARIAAEKMTPRDIEKLRDINARLKEVAEREEVESYFMRNDEFHRYFIRLCGNEKLAEIRENIAQRFRGFRMAALSISGRLLESARQHEQIIQAFEEHDGQLAEKLVVEHALLGGGNLVEKIESRQRSPEGEGA